MKYKKFKAYMKYLIRHKWYVYQECKKYGLIWRGIKHDLSKFRPSEFIPYAHFFYNDDGSMKSKRDETGYYKPTYTGDYKFDWAWSLHCKRNSHHWQYWTTANDYDNLKMFDICEDDIREMICDWYGAARAQGHNPPNIMRWYKANRNKMQITTKTAKRVAEMLVEMNSVGHQ